MRKLLLSFVMTCAVAAQATAGVVVDRTYTRFLVPLYQPEVAGAFGSRWRVDTWFYYTGSAAIGPAIVPAPFCSFDVCTFEIKLDNTTIGRPLPVEPRFFTGSGLLLHVESQYADGFTFASRVWDASREEDSAGTEIAVVRESRFSEHPLHLLNVPIAARFRNMLRIYALPEVPNPEVEVRYYDMPDRFDLIVDPDPIRIERLHLRTYPASQGFLLHPALTEIAGFEGRPEFAGKTALWIDIVPITPGLRVWAFASVTDNDTQQVTVVSPVGR